MTKSEQQVCPECRGGGYFSWPEMGKDGEDLDFQCPVCGGLGTIQKIK